MGERTSTRATDIHGFLLGDLEPGARIGDYKIDGRRPSWGTGLVYEATHRLLPRRVTIKVLPAAQHWVREMALDLLREACIVEALDHPGVPRVYECGLMPDRRPWIATELVEGITLAAAAEEFPMSAADIAVYIRDVADILVHAHERGLIHRNLLPSTIVIPARVRRSSVCLVDWQGARLFDSATPLPLLAAEHAKRYMAPELVRNETVDGRADVYALGVIMRDMIAMASPRISEVPHLLAALIRRMMAPNPADRPTSADVLASARWLAASLEAAVPAEVDGVPTQPMPMAPTRPHAITSDFRHEVSGEIDLRTRALRP